LTPPSEGISLPASLPLMEAYPIERRTQPSPVLCVQLRRCRKTCREVGYTRGWEALAPVSGLLDQLPPGETVGVRSCPDGRQVRRDGMERRPLRKSAPAQEVALVRYTRGTPERIRAALHLRGMAAALLAPGVPVSGKAVRGWGRRLREYARTANGLVGNLMTQGGGLRPPMNSHKNSPRV
jgi:hypothetical protein